MVRWTSHAKAQLCHIHAYLAKDSPFYAKRVSKALIRRTIDLTSRHKSKVASELNIESVRERSIYTYRILYEIQSDELVIVLAIIHEARYFKHNDAY